MTKWLFRPAGIAAIAVAMIVVQAVVRGWWVGHGWYLVDDYLFLSDIARGADDLDWYLRIHQGHFMPLSFVLVKAVTLFGGVYDWSAVAVEIVALQVIASLTCWWMFRTLFGPTRAALAGLAIYLTSAFTMPSIMWWAVAINQLPHQIAFFGAITAHVLYARTRRIRWVAVAGLFLLVGYTSYAKTGLIVVTLALLTLIWLVDGAPWHRFWDAIRRFWLAWAVYGTLSVAWLVVYLSRPSASLSAEPGRLLPLVQAEVLENAVPTVVGGPWAWRSFAGDSPVQFADPPIIAVVVAAVLLALLLLVAWARHARSLLVLWPVVVYFSASVLLVYVGRAYTVTLLGAENIGRHVQYLSDLIPLIVLAAVALFVPIVGVADPIRLRPEPFITVAPRRWTAVALVVGVSISGLASSAVYAQGWRSFGERTASENAIAAITEGPRHRFAEAFVPSTIVSPIFGERALLSSFFAPLGSQYTTSTTGIDLAMLNREGGIEPADVSPVESGPAVAPLESCRPTDEVGQVFDLEVPFSFGLWLVVDYRSSSAGALTVVGTGEPMTGIEAPAGNHRLLIQATAPGETVRVYATGDPDLCVNRIGYGLVSSE